MIKKKLFLKNQKGIAILFIILITGVIFTIALGINSISVQQTKMMGEVGHSVVSFYAADSGAEAQLYDLFKRSESQHLPSYTEAFSNTASFDSYVTCSNSAVSCFNNIPRSTNCSAGNYCVGSVGKYQEVKRAIEIKY